MKDYWDTQQQKLGIERQAADLHQKQKEAMGTAIRSGNNKMLQEAIAMDPAYAGDAIKSIMTEQQKGKQTPADQKMYSDLELMKLKARYPFFK
jgi:hypothetical protein